MRRIIACCLITVVALAAAYTIRPVHARDPNTVRRAKPPTFNDSQSSRIFFNDVFSEALQGERPDNLGQVVNQGTPRATSGGNGGGTAVASGEGFHPWAKVISPVAIEDEIKALKLEVDKDITTPTKFASNGFKQARRNFSILATMFAIAAEYDGDVRWKKDAHNLRDVFARSAGNAKVGTIQVYNEAKLRKQDLQDVIGGGAFSAAKEAELKADWSQVVDRTPLMQRIEAAQQAKMQPWTANEADFKTNKDQLVHEANIVAAIGEVLVQEGMEDGDDEDYAVHAIAMRDAALDVVSAVKVDNYELARKAVGAIGQACSKCHADWR